MRWTQAEEKFAEILPGFQIRVNQQKLAQEIESSLEDGAHLLAQAGCGTGKSFAAAIPAVEHSKTTGQPVIYATATKALQDQLATKDLPFLKDNLGDFEFAVLKGRSNYVCMAKVDELEDPSFKSLVTEAVAQEGFSGEIVDLTTVDARDGSKLSTTSDECPGKNDCPFGDVCFSERAKTKAKTANVVVVNHAVLASDLAIKEKQELAGIPANKVTGILPRFSAVIIDEEHEFTDSVTNALGGEVTGGSYHRLAKEVAEFLTDRDVLRKIDGATDALFAVVASALNKREDKRNRTLPVDNNLLSDLASPMADLQSVLRTYESKVTNHPVHGNDKAKQKQKRLVRKLANAADKLANIVTAEQADLVRWLGAGDAKKGDTIEWAPLTVSDFLRRNLWSKAPAVLMSATVALGSDFSFQQDQVGLDDARHFDAGTPFDFKSQAMTFVPQIPAPAGATQQQWRASSIAVTKELVRASNGRALLLFTSKTGMEDAYTAIAPMVAKMGHKALKQGERPNKELAATFKSDEHSVLFALKSFFTGVDIQGDSLRLVVIDKLPFPVPTDVIFKARTDALDNQYGKMAGFNKLSVPTMALSVLQAYGRLIRTVNDRGLVAILDSRLEGKGQKNYGARIMRALPESPVVTDLTDAVSYLEGLES